MLRSDWLFFSSFDPFLCEEKRINRTNQPSLKNHFMPTLLLQGCRGIFFLILNILSFDDNNDNEGI